MNSLSLNEKQKVEFNTMFFFTLMCNSFWWTVHITTVLFFRAGCVVQYVPCQAGLAKHWPHGPNSTKNYRMCFCAKTILKTWREVNFSDVSESLEEYSTPCRITDMKLVFMTFAHLNEALWEEQENIWWAVTRISNWRLLSKKKRTHFHSFGYLILL